MKMLKSVAVLLFVLTAAMTESSNSYLQQDSGENCPTIQVECPEDDSGQHIRFRAKVAIGVPDQKVGFKWKVSGGRITSGQGTEQITVKSKRTKGQRLTATVEVLGSFPKGCNTTASCSTTIASR
jgi:hypothetical protein